MKCSYQILPHYIYYVIFKYYYNNMYFFYKLFNLDEWIQRYEREEEGKRKRKDPLHLHTFSSGWNPAFFCPFLLLFHDLGHSLNLMANKLLPKGKKELMIERHCKLKNRDVKDS